MEAYVVFVAFVAQDFEAFLLPFEREGSYDSSSVSCNALFFMFSKENSSVVQNCLLRILAKISE